MKKMDLKRFGIVVNIDSHIDINDFGHIYLFVNKIDNKKYVGQSINVLRRINEHLRNRKKNANKPLNIALINSSINNFDIFIIDSAKNMDELNEKEIYYIIQYNTTNRDFGYNIESGGNNSIPSKETLEKMSKSHLGIKQSDNWVKLRIAPAGSDEAKKYGKNKTDEERKQISENSPKFWLGKKRDSETIKKISETKLSKGFTDKQKEANCRKVYGFSVDTKILVKEYESTANASKCEHVNQSTISRWCKNNKVINDYIWSYNVLTQEELGVICDHYYESIKVQPKIELPSKPKVVTEETRKKLSESHKNIKQSPEWVEKRIEGFSKPVIKLEVRTNTIIDEFKSLADAGRNNYDGLSYEAISRLCLGISKNIGEYVWCYKEDFINKTIPNYVMMDNREFNTLSKEELDEMFSKYTNDNISIRQISKDHNVNFLTLNTYFKTRLKPESIFKDDINYIAICKKTGKSFSDYINKSGSLTNHIIENYPGIILDSKFKRKQIEYNTGKPWYYDYFNFKEVN